MKKNLVSLIVLLVMANCASAQNVVSCTYWFDNNFSAATSKNTNGNLNTAISTSSINPGPHTVYFYFSDNNGKRSSISASSIYKTSSSVDSTGMEYWFDDEFNNHQWVNLAGTDLNNIDLNSVSITGLDMGNHTINVRFKISGGMWSGITVASFTKTSGGNGSGTPQAEYWFDDITTAKRSALDISNINNVDINPPVTNLSLGYHIIYTRLKDAGGIWSSVNATPFVKNSVPGGASTYEFWFDNNFTTRKKVTITNASGISNKIKVDTTGPGLHKINFRFQLNGGLWSGIITDTFRNAGTPCNITNLTAGEALDATTYLCENDIILHTQDGAYNAATAMQRKDLAKIAYRALFGVYDNPVLSDYFPSPYSDLQLRNTSNDYYFSAAKALSYVDYGDGIAPFNRDRINFYPDDNIARGYALKVFLEAYNIAVDTTLPNPFTDVIKGQEIYGYVVTAAAYGLIQTPSNGGSTLFRPYDNITREDAFLILYRMMTTKSKPLVTNNDFYKPFDISHYAGANGAGIDQGNFNSYSENCFNVKGVPSLDFSFTYSAVNTEMPDEFYNKADAANKTLYNQRPMGFGWNHSYNAYIVIDRGLTVANSDDRYELFWPGGGLQVFNPVTKKYISLGVYDVLTANNYTNPSTISIVTKSQITYTFQRISGSTYTDILLLTSVKDRNNNTVSLTYENGFSGSSAVTMKRLKQVNDGKGRNFTFSYFTNSNLASSVTSNAGNIVRTVNFNYNSNDLIIYKNPNGDTTRYAYINGVGQSHLLQQIKLPKGKTIDNTYSRRKLTSTQSSGKYNTAINTISDFSETGSNIQSTVTEIRDGKTLKSNTTLDAATGMPVSSAGPQDNTAVEYADAINPTKPTTVTDNLTGLITKMVYDAKGNLLSIKKTGRDSITQTYTYTTLNDIATVKDGKGFTSSYTYTNGNLTKLTYPDLSFITIANNSNGTVSNVSNQSGIVSNFTYDTYGNIAGSAIPLGISSSQVNDGAGRAIAVTNPNNKITAYQYDKNDNRLKETADTTGLKHATQFIFDKNDNLTSIINAKNQSTSLSYNNNDELIQEQFGNAVKSYTYNDDGTLQAFTNPNGTSFAMQYNDKGQLANDGYSSYVYNGDNTIQSVTKTDNGKKINYYYDAYKRVTKIKYNDFSANSVSYEYDNNNNITKIIYPDGFTVLYEYDENNHLTKVKDANNNPYATYTYLADGRLNTQTNGNGTITKYFYDAAGRMDSLVNLKSTQTVIAAYKFGIDLNGNHTNESITQPAAALPPKTNANIGYTYSNDNRLLTRADENYTYENNGNNTVVTKGAVTRNYDYDEKNNLITYSDGSSTANSYEYDGLMQRRKKNSTRYVLDMAQNVLEETDLYGTPMYYYIHGIGLIARVKVSSSQPYYYHYDYRGSTVAITNAAETITHKYSYGSFGEKQSVTEEDFNTYRYVGKYGVQYEDSTLYFIRARYYNPVAGRFLSEDPIWSTNLYPYAGNNPVINIDPFGLEEIAAVVNTLNSYYSNLSTLQSAEDMINFIDQLHKASKVSTFVKQTSSLFEVGFLDAASSAIDTDIGQYVLNNADGVFTNLSKLKKDDFINFKNDFLEKWDKKKYDLTFWKTIGNGILNGDAFKDGLDFNKMLLKSTFQATYNAIPFWLKPQDYGELFK